MRRPPSLLFAPAALLVLACAHLEPPPSEPEPFARSLLALLDQGELEEAASWFHYPADWSASERRADAAGVEAQLGRLTRLFGRFGTVRLSTEPTHAIEFGVFPGTLSYWQALPKQGVDAVAVYRTHFVLAGDGIIAVALYHSMAGYRVRALAFGIDASQEHALRFAERAERELRTAFDAHSRD